MVLISKAFSFWNPILICNFRVTCSSFYSSVLQGLIAAAWFITSVIFSLTSLIIHDSIFQLHHYIFIGRLFYLYLIYHLSPCPSLLRFSCLIRKQQQIWYLILSSSHPWPLSSISFFTIASFSSLMIHFSSPTLYLCLFIRIELIYHLVQVFFDLLKRTLNFSRSYFVIFSVSNMNIFRCMLINISSDISIASNRHYKEKIYTLDLKYV